MTDGKREATLTTSWDDGHPLDLRLAERLARHGVAATFYLPIRNREGRPVLNTAEVRELAAAGFAIGSHTHDHVRLESLDEGAIIRQMVWGREVLEDRLGRAVTGFCPPGGRAVARVRRVAPGLGFTHVRTVEMFRLDPGTDPFACPTTLHFHPHGPLPLLRNWGRQGLGRERLRLCLGCLGRSSLEARLEWLLEEAIGRGGVLHVWGHSWEIEETGSWPLLDRFLARATERIPAARRLDNATAFEAAACVS
ncbi:MAG: polysaccharide deacetylase family protein [Alphaproteobacteria bacterium]